MFTAECCTASPLMHIIPAYALLADALRDGGFRAKPILRAIALSRTYQRSFEPPAIDAAAIASIAAMPSPMVLPGAKPAETVADMYRL